MKKSKQLNQWLWKWHIIAGLVSVPVIALLCITGSIYLFKDNFNDYVYQKARFTETAATSDVSYAEQLNTVTSHTDAHVVSVTLPTSPQQTTAFRLHSKGHSTNLVYVDPYTNKVTGTYKQEESLMYTVRKLHGELLLGLPGTLLVEIIASWFVVLALTGIYVWWPLRGFSSAGFFTIRTKKTRRLFWRDLHSVVGFWMSAFMLIILAGGMPWTELFGDQLKWVQKQTDTGYPQHWRDSKGLTSNPVPTDTASPQAISLDLVVSASQQLPGEITIKLPQDKDGVYSISNRTFWLKDQQVIHLDQYSGAPVKALQWNQVGVLMELRQFFMRLHQGEYGIISLIAVLLVALTFLVSTIASLVSYFIRKPQGSWGLPDVPEGFNAGTMVVAAMAVLGVVFPAFGASVLLILLVAQLRKLVTAQKSETEPREAR